MHPALTVAKHDGNLYFMVLCPRNSVLRLWKGTERGAEVGEGIASSKELTAM